MQYLKFSHSGKGPTMSRCTHENLALGVGIVDNSVFVCLCIFDLWQDIQVLAHKCTSLFIDGQKNFSVTNLRVSRMPACANPWIESNTCFRNPFGTYGRNFPVDVSQVRLIFNAGNLRFSNFMSGCCWYWLSSSSSSCAFAISS